MSHRSNRPSTSGDSTSTTSWRRSSPLSARSPRFAPTGSALLVDIGSTTTDLIPLRDGVAVPTGRTDTERLASGELVYTGVRRTPACALLGGGGRVLPYQPGAAGRHAHRDAAPVGRGGPRAERRIGLARHDSLYLGQPPAVADADMLRDAHARPRLILRFGGSRDHAGETLSRETARAVISSALYGLSRGKRACSSCSWLSSQ